jgi:hypothetical protein
VENWCCKSKSIEPDPVDSMKIPFETTLAICILCFANIIMAETVKQCFPESNLPGRSTQSFWIPKTGLKETNIHRELSKNLSGSLFSSLREKYGSVLLQELTNGEGTALIFREHFKGWPGLTDTSTIKYLTINVPGKLVKNREIDISKDETIFTVLAEGSSSWRNLCFGYAKKGKISLQVSNGYDDEFMNKMWGPIFKAIGEDSVLMDIDVLVTTKNSNEAWPEQCGTCVLQGSFVFLKSSLSDFNKGRGDN